MRELFIASMDDRSDRLLMRLVSLLSGCRYPLKVRYSSAFEWETVTDTDHDTLDSDISALEGMKEGEPLFSSLGGPGKGQRIRSTAHQLNDEDIQLMDDLAENIERGDMVLMIMDMDRKIGHACAQYLSERVIGKGSFSLGFVIKTGDFKDIRQIEDMNRELITLSGYFNGLAAVPPRVTKEGRNIDLAHMIRHLTDMAFTPGIVNLDHADLMLTSKGGSILIMTWGAARPGGDRAATSVKDALTRSLCDVDLRSVRKALVNVVGSGDLTLEDSLVASEYLKKRVRSNAHIIWGVSLIDGMEDDMEVFLILATTPMELLLHWYGK
jgi:cell division GTPase FtsZ